MAVAIEETESTASRANELLVCAISKTPSGEHISEISIDIACEINNGGKRTFKYTIVSGGRRLWKQWMDNGDMYLSLNASEAYRVCLSAFPSDPRTGHGYVELLQAVE